MKKKVIDYSKYPESDLIIEHIHKRLKKGLYTHVPVTGLPGTGKSSTCQRLAELFYEKLGGNRRLKQEDIVDSLLKFMRRLKKVKKPGTVIIIEEISVLFPSRRAMAKDNVAIGRVLDTCRKKQVILFSNAPIWTSIDSHIRAMSHILIETQKIVKKAEVVVYKSWRLQTAPHTGKTYRHRFTRNGRDISLFYTKKPSPEIWDEYEKGKDEFMDNLYEELEADAKKKQDKRDKLIGAHLKGQIMKKPDEMHKRRWELKQQLGTLAAVARYEGCNESSASRSINKWHNYKLYLARNPDIASKREKERP